MKKSIIAFCICTLALSFTTYSQKIKLKEGSLDKITSESEFNIEFTYDSLQIKKFANEAEYVAYITAYYNKQYEGGGDKQAERWISDRESKYKPKFNLLFEKYSKTQVSSKAKYTIIFHTTYMDMGPNPTGVNRSSGRQVSIDGEVIIVETANRNNKIALLSVENEKGGTFESRYDPGTQIAQCYFNAGKDLGRLISKAD
ncbi:MAG: hypothetical protein QM737_16075 [Ferruginibacter sp.]